MNEPVWPDAALFDLDGTLMDREPLMLEAMRRVLSARDAALDEGSLGSMVGRAWTDVYGALAVDHRFGWTFDEFIDAVFGVADGLLADGFPTRVLEGGRPLIERLVGRRVRVGVVTGSLRREVPGALDRVGVAEHVSLVLAAEDYGAGKPDPECYLRAARLLEVEPRRCVVFEDSAHGVASGRAAGMRVIATADANPPVGHPSHQDLSAADVVVARLSEVRDEHLRMDQL